MEESTQKNEDINKNNDNILENENNSENVISSQKLEKEDKKHKKHHKKHDENDHEKHGVSYFISHQKHEFDDYCKKRKRRNRKSSHLLGKFAKMQFEKLPLKTRKILQLTYDIFFILLILTSIILVILSLVTDLTHTKLITIDGKPLPALKNMINVNFKENPYLSINLFILIILIIDTLIRFIFTCNRSQFIKSNFMLILSLLPFHPYVIFLRIFRLFQLLRIFTIIEKSKNKYISKASKKINKALISFNNFLNTNGLIYILLITSIFLMVSGYVFSKLENGHHTEYVGFGEGLWWAVVTFTTVGYGDISPVTPVGKILSGIVMVFGIGFIGLLTSTVTSFFANRVINKKISILDVKANEIYRQEQINKRKMLNQNQVDNKNQDLDYIDEPKKLTLDDFEKLTDEQKELILKLINSLSSNN